VGPLGGQRANAEEWKKLPIETPLSSPGMSRALTGPIESGTNGLPTDATTSTAREENLLPSSSFLSSDFLPFDLSLALLLLVLVLVRVCSLFFLERNSDLLRRCQECPMR